jgi:glycosyl transferase, family 25
MQSYVINLDRSPERLRYFQTQAEAVGLDFERISAFDGKLLPNNVISRMRSIPFQFQPVDIGNIGLLLSHQVAWEKLLQSNAPHAAVFEDDAILAPSIVRTLRAIDEQQPEFDLIKLETTLRKVVCSRQAVVLDSGNTLRTLLTWHGGTAGYVVSRRGAEQLLAKRDETSDIIDLLLFHPSSRATSNFVVQQLVPAACIQSQFLKQQSNPTFESTLGKPSVGDQFLRYGLKVDSKRFVRRQLESIRRRFLASRPSNEQLFVSFAATDQTCRVA